MEKTGNQQKTNNPKQFWQHLKTLRERSKSSTVDVIPPRQWIEHFCKFFNVKENATVENNLLKATNCKCVNHYSNPQIREGGGGGSDYPDDFRGITI